MEIGQIKSNIILFMLSVFLTLGLASAISIAAYSLNQLIMETMLFPFPPVSQFKQVPLFLLSVCLPVSCLSVSISIMISVPCEASKWPSGSAVKRRLGSAHPYPRNELSL
jgi:hypothetical protein